MKIPIIGMGGIMDARDALEFFIAGADAVQVGTANFVDPFVWGKILDGIGDYMTRHGIARIADLVGAVHRTEPFTARMNPILVALDVPTTRDAVAGRRIPCGTSAGSRSAGSCSPSRARRWCASWSARGDRVFLDLKYHDIPNTVAGAVRARRRRSACGWSTSTPAAG